MRQLFSEIGQQAPVIRERRETDQMSQMVTQTAWGQSFNHCKHAEVRAENSGPAKLRQLRLGFKAAERAGIKTVHQRGQSCTEKEVQKSTWGRVVAHGYLGKLGCAWIGQDYLRITRAAVWLCILEVLQLGCL